MSARAEIYCFDGDGAVSAIALVGEDGIEQVRGDVASMRELLQMLRRDPLTTSHDR